MNVDEMPAGPEMDRLIAERVMGWAWGSCDFAAGPDVFGDWQEAKTVHGPITKPGGWWVRNDWRPSANIAHAWEVAEKLRLLVFPRDGGWAAALAEYGLAHGEHWIDDTIGHYASAPTAPLAICRSALLVAKRREP